MPTIIKDPILQSKYISNIEYNNGYVLPIASTSSLGGVKIGSGFSISNGLLSLSIKDTIDRLFIYCK